MIVWLLDSSNPWFDSHELFTITNILDLEIETVFFWPLLVIRIVLFLLTSMFVYSHS
jgi:hypothetical protein